MLLESKYLNDEFAFDDIINELQINDNILKALSDSHFLKKMWFISITDMRSISSEGILSILSSKNLHPFFDVERFLSNLKSILTDDIIIAMSQNSLCVNNLFDLNLEGSNNVTQESIKTLLQSKFICPFFRVSNFLEKIRF